MKNSSIPGLERLVEGVRMGNHAVHAGDLPDAPPVDILVEGGSAWGVVHELCHVRDGAHVPRRHGAIRCLRSCWVGTPLSQRTLEAGLVGKGARR